MAGIALRNGSGVNDIEVRQDEFRQLCRSYLRLYTLIAQVVRLDDISLDRMHEYLDWLVRMLPNRQVPLEIAVTDDMLSLRKFRTEERERGNASTSPGGQDSVTAIEEFGARPYSEDEQGELSEIHESLQQAPWHGFHGRRHDPDPAGQS